MKTNLLKTFYTVSLLPILAFSLSLSPSSGSKAVNRDYRVALEASDAVDSTVFQVYVNYPANTTFKSIEGGDFDCNPNTQEGDNSVRVACFQNIGSEYMNGDGTVAYLTFSTSSTGSVELTLSEPLADGADTTPTLQGATYTIVEQTSLPDTKVISSTNYTVYGGIFLCIIAAVLILFNIVSKLRVYFKQSYFYGRFTNFKEISETDQITEEMRSKI